MTVHGRAQDPHQITTQTKCKCGREFADERGLLVHMGRMGKLSGMVLSKREQIVAEKYVPSNPNQGSY